MTLSCVDAGVCGLCPVFFSIALFLTHPSVRLLVLPLPFKSRGWPFDFQRTFYVKRECCVNRKKNSVMKYTAFCREKELRLCSMSQKCSKDPCCLNVSNMFFGVPAVSPSRIWDARLLNISKKKRKNL
jgi:hypothetical protein